MKSLGVLEYQTLYLSVGLISIIELRKYYTTDEFHFAFNYENNALLDHNSHSNSTDDSKGYILKNSFSPASLKDM